MKQNKHQPKSSKKKFSLSDDAEKVMVGTMLALIGLIGLLNLGVVGQFLTYISVYAFGAFYYFFMIFVMAFGVYLAIKKKALSVKVNLYLLGASFLIVTLMMGASLSIDKLTIKTLFSVYNHQMELVSNSFFVINNFASLGSTGGGFIGATLVALLNSALTPLGTRVVVIFLMLVSLTLLAKKPLNKLRLFLIAKSKSRKEKKSATLVTPKVETDKDSIPLNVTEPGEMFPELKNDTTYRNSPFRYAEPTTSERTSSLFVDETEIKQPVTEKVSPLVDESEVKQEKNSGFMDIFKRKNQSLEDEDISLLSSKFAEAPSLKEHGQDFTTEGNSISHTTILTSPKKERVESTPSVDRRYMLPSSYMLNEHKDDSKNELNNSSNLEKAKEINRVFNDFKLKASVVSFTIGPSISRFNIKTETGVRVNSLSGLVSEIQVALHGDKSVRIETVVEGSDTSGIEVRNAAPTPVSFKDCFNSIEHKHLDKLVVPIGQDINREVITVSIDDLPHLLVAGTTGSGKSVFIHSIIMTLIMRNYPEELRLIMIDPKKVEFTKYNNIPHLYCPIITDPIQAIAALHKLINEMERRFTLMAREEVVNIKEYRRVQEADSSKEILPNIVVIIDEFADLISSNAKEVEPLIQRLAQKARASGIYLIVATQRPSVKVITGDIKANIPARIALSVSSTFDSKTILDEFGAETLIGKGDLLARMPSSKFLVRVQSAYVDNDEISKVTNYLKEQAKPIFNQEFLNLKTPEEADEFNSSNGFNKSDSLHDKFREDPMYPAIKDYVIGSGVAATSNIMRNFGLGYGRAAAFLDTLEDDGVIMSKPGGRKIVIVRPEE